MIDKINLFNGLNLNPIPLEFHQSMSTTKQLAALQSGINSIIDIINSMITTNNQYTDEQITIIMGLLNGINTLDGKFLKNQSVTIDKLSDDSISSLHDKIMTYIGKIMTFITFEINDNGYFVANIPETWNSIDFITDTEGHLILNMNY